MIPLPFAAIGLFMKDNIKWLAIGLGIVVIGLMAWKYTATVREAATLRLQNAQLAQNIKDKEEALQAERDLNKIKEQIIEQQTQSILQLQDDLMSVTTNLPTDKDQLAPEAIRETIKRLRDKQ